MCKACARHCYFCRERGYQSKNCPKYTTDRTRKKIADEKKFCRFCFIKSFAKHLSDGISECNKSCCDGWYSTEHHTAFCPDRIKGLLAKQLFLPRIDQNLWQRFASTLQFDEQLLLALSSQRAQNFYSPKHIKLIEKPFSDSDWKESPEKFSNPDGIFVVTHATDSYQTYSKKFLKLLSLKQAICTARIIELHGEKISSDQILQLLSTYTREIVLQKLKSDITFTEIVKNAPNIVGLYIWDHTSVKINKETWLDDLMKYKNGNNFCDISLDLKNIEFDLDKMEKFIKVGFT